MSIKDATARGHSHPLIMGVLNVTPDSFSDGGRFVDEDGAVAHGLKMAAEGAVIVDVGGESTRPGSGRVSAVDQLTRVRGVIGRQTDPADQKDDDRYKQQMPYSDRRLEWRRFIWLAGAHLRPGFRPVAGPHTP